VRAGRDGRAERGAAPMTAAARTGRGPGHPPCRASSRRARSQSRALPLVASSRRWVQAPALEYHLLRQDHRYLSEGRGRARRSEASRNRSWLTICRQSRSAVRRTTCR
jgi:hypothetical protein